MNHRSTINIEITKTAIPYWANPYQMPGSVHKANRILYKTSQKDVPLYKVEDRTKYVEGKNKQHNIWDVWY
jgi:hypothetical protein